MSWQPTEPLIAYRSWKLPADGLLPLTRGDEPWEPGATRAACDGRPGTFDHPRDDVPHRDCTCGWYAHYRAPAIVACRGATVVGAIQVWGAIELHEDGLRAEHARPVAFTAPVHDLALRTRLAAVAAEHSAIVVAPGELAAAASEFGSTLPAEEQPASGLGLLATALEQVADRDLGAGPRLREPAHAAAVWALIAVLDAARMRGLLDPSDPDRLICTVRDATDAAGAAALELFGDSDVVTARG